MSQDPSVTHRPTLLDVFENFFGEQVTELSGDSVAKLPAPRLDELIEVIDMFLEAARKQEYPSEAVMADALTDPIIIPDDHLEPRTTRRAKQIALAHREVVIPMQPLSIDYRLDENREKASRPVQSLLEWARRNHALLRGHVLSVTGRTNPFDVLGDDETRQLVSEMVNAMQHQSSPDMQYLVGRDVDIKSTEAQDALEAWMYGVLLDAVNAGSIGANLAFLDESSGKLYARMSSVLMHSSFSRESVCVRNVQTLQQLQMPAIDDIPDSDFVAIRMQSEDFEEFRAALGRLLERTEFAEKSEQDVSKVFRDNLLEVRLRADQLRREVKDKAIRPFLRNNVQNISLGAVASTAAAAASDLTQESVHPQALAARLFTGVALSTLFAALLYRAPERQLRLLRFYNVLLDDRTAAH